MNKKVCKKCKGKKIRNSTVKRIFKKHLTKDDYKPIECPRCKGTGIEP